jgi:hypothetical protein
MSRDTNSSPMIYPLTYPPPSNEDSRRQLAKLCGELLGRIFDPQTDVRTAAEQLRQGAEIVLANVNH